MSVLSTTKTRLRSRKERSTVPRRLWLDLRPQAKWLSLGLVVMLLANGFNLVLPLYLKQLVDGFGGLAEVSRTIAMLGFVFAGQSIMGYAYGYLFTFSAENMARDMQIKLYDHLQQLPLAFHTRRRVGELSSRFTSDIRQLRALVDTHIAGLIQHGVMVLGVGGIMIFLNWRLTLITLSVILVVALLATTIMQKVRKNSAEAQNEIAHSAGVLEEALRGIATIKAFVREDYERGRIQTVVDKSYQANMRREKTQLFLLPLSNIMLFGSLMAVIWFGTRQIESNLITSGDLVAYFAYAVMLAASFSNVSKHLGGISKGLGVVEGVYKLFDEPLKKVKGLGRDHKITKLDGSLQFRDVTLRYPDTDQAALRNFSLTINPGETVAVVGPSGAGKSTLTNLLMGFYSAQQGEIYIDNHPLKALDIDSLRRHIGLVSQNVHLFTGSVRDNIRYGRLDATDAEVEMAAEQANAHTFISELTDGYDTQVGRDGAALSGGQRQRIAIARVLLKNPDILILDEATSALDSESERLVHAAIDQLIEGKTTLIIAHRLSTIQNADRIIVMENGQLTESGTHEALMTKQALYHKLYQQQTTHIKNKSI